MTTTITPRVSGSIGGTSTPRLQPEAVVLDPWDGAWGDSWGDAWGISAVTVDVDSTTTKRVTGSPSANITKRVTL